MSLPSMFYFWCEDDDYCGLTWRDAIASSASNSNDGRVALIGSMRRAPYACANCILNSPVTCHAEVASLCPRSCLRVLGLHLQEPSCELPNGRRPRGAAQSVFL